MNCGEAAQSANVISRLKNRMGEFWWYSLLIFIAARSGDVIQAYIGLWLVPHYVPQEELGTVLPLLQMANVVCLPLSILLVPYMKFANAYAARGELGKLKSLLRMAFIGALVVFVVMFVVSKFLMPMFFECMRIAEGMLGTLILAQGLVNAVSPVFGNTLQTLKKFNKLFWVNVLGAPVRLVVMLLAMPFRALSGYMLGQMAPALVTIGGSVLGLREELGKECKAKPLDASDFRAMWKYTWPIAINTAIGVSLLGWQALLIRQRLPEVESAAYYIISRLAEIGCYVGMSLAVVMFPYAAEAEAKGKEQSGLLRKMLMGSALAGIAFALFYAIFGRMILGMVALWSPYQQYAPEMVLLTLIMTMRLLIGSFASYETAQSRFKWVLWLPLTSIVETLPLVCFTGHGAFRGILPNSVVDWMASLDAGRLDFFLWWFFAVAALQNICMIVQLLLRRRKRLRLCQPTAGEKTHPDLSLLSGEKHRAAPHGRGRGKARVKAY